MHSVLDASLILWSWQNLEDDRKLDPLNLTTTIASITHLAIPRIFSTL